MPDLNPNTAMEEVLAVLAKANQISDPRMGHLDLAKSTFSQSGSATTGLTFYDLEAGAKFLYPVLTPLRNEIPRVSGKGGIQANWRAVTGVNTSGIRVGVSGGNRGAVMAVSTQDYIAAYKGIGIEDNVDFEAQYAGMGFDDIRAIAARTGLEALMLGEEQLLFGGDGTLALGTAPTASMTTAATGGGLSDGTYHVRVVALTLEGLAATTVAAGVPGQISRTNADASVDLFGGGNSQISADASITIAGGTATQKITATCAAVRGAVGYAWFWGATANGATIGAITTVPVNVITTATGAGTQVANAAAVTSDWSTNNLVFDGLLTQALKTGSNAYWKDMGGTALTGDGAGGIVEFDTMLADRWNNYRLSPDTAWVNAQEALSLGRIVLGSTNTGAYRIVVDMTQGAIMGGVVVATYMNKFTMGGANVIKIRLHPNAPAGTILFTTGKSPYPLSNVGNMMQVRTRQDYYQIEWPLRTRKYEYGVYADQVLQHYFPPSMAVITGIAPTP